jgi:tetratricopeptide (TPR) repeat protein
MKDLTGARDSAQKAMQLSPTDVRALVLYSQAAQALGDTDGALNAWNTWFAAHPTDDAAASRLGELEEAKGDKVRAMQLYQKALALKPGQPVASNNLAVLMVDQNGNLDTALRLAQDARSGLPNSPSTADTLAWVYYAKGRYLSARDLLEDATKADPNNADMQYHLGMTYKKLGDKTNAALHLKKAETLAPATSQTGKEAAEALSQPG